MLLTSSSSLICHHHWDNERVMAASKTKDAHERYVRGDAISTENL